MLEVSACFEHPGRSMEAALSKVAPQLFGVPGVIVSRSPTEARCMVNGVFGDVHDGPMLFSKCQWVSCSERPGVQLSEVKVSCMVVLRGLRVTEASHTSVFPYARQFPLPHFIRLVSNYHSPLSLPLPSRRFRVPASAVVLCTHSVEVHRT